MKMIEIFENCIKAKAYDASLKNIERKIKELEDSTDKDFLAGLNYARVIMKKQLRFIRFTHSK